MLGLARDRRLGPDGVHPSVEAFVHNLRGLGARLLQKRVGLVTTGRRQGGARESDVHLCSSPGSALVVPQPRQQRRTDVDGSVAFAGKGQHLGKAVLDVEHGRIGRGQQTAGTVEGGLRARQSTALEAPPASLEEERARPAAVTRSLGELCSQLAPVVLQVGMCRFDSLERTTRQRGPLGRDELDDHGVPGERVAEAERPLAPVHGDDLRVHRGAQRGEDLFLAEPCDRGEKAPVEPPAEDGGGEQHQPRGVAECGDPAADAVGEGEWNDGLDPVRPRPRPAFGDERARCHRRRQQLLHQERDAVGPRRELEHLVRDGVHSEARADHLGHLQPAEARQLQEPRHASGMKGPPQLEPR